MVLGSKLASQELDGDLKVPPIDMCKVHKVHKVRRCLKTSGKPTRVAYTKRMNFILAGFVI